MTTNTYSIDKIQSIVDVEIYFQDATDKTLGIFDIDETLLIPADPAFQKPNARKHANIVQPIKEQFDLEKQDLLSNLILILSQSQLLEENSPQLIAKLQKQGIPLIALTAAMTRKFNQHYLPEMRYGELLKWGINFAGAFADKQHILIDSVSVCNNSVPIFYSGILCSNGDHRRHNSATSKGKVLCEFLKQAAWRPTSIIFVDDKLYNLEEMRHALYAFDPHICYQGLHYIGNQMITSPDIHEELIKAKWNELSNQVKFYSQYH